MSPVMRADVKKTITWKVENKGETVNSQVVSFLDGRVYKASLEVDKRRFEVVDAVLSITGKETHTNKNLDCLKGIEAYIPGKKIIRSKLEGYEKFAIECFLQCVSALVQAETYLYVERGYVSKAEYNVYWDMLEKNGCRFYSDSRQYLREGALTWMEYVPDRYGADILFERNKEYNVFRIGEIYELYAHLKDTFHEMKMSIKLDCDLTVKDAVLEVLRAPGVACMTNRENEHKLIGGDFGNITKREIIEKLGGSDGCYHLVEMGIELQELIKGLY